MTLEEIEKRLAELDDIRVKAKNEGETLKKEREELLESKEFDEQLANMPAAKRFKFLRKLGKTEDEIKDIESKLPIKSSIVVQANMTDLNIKSQSA